MYIYQIKKHYQILWRSTRMPVDNCNGCAFWAFCHGCLCAGCSCAAVHLRAVLAVLRGLYPPASTLPPPSGCRFQPARDKKVPCQDQSVAQQNEDYSSGNERSTPMAPSFLIPRLLRSSKNSEN